MTMELSFDNTYVRELKGLFEPFSPQRAPSPRLLAFNGPLARTLGISEEACTSQEGISCLVGNALPDGAASVALAYAGHQFGNYSPRLGDGRALLLGEILTPEKARVDLHFKGTGATPFSRGGDGKAAVGPMLREFIMGEAMHGLRIPTTRALSVVATGEDIARDEWLPGAVLLRVAQSHLRVGTFQFVAAKGDIEVLRRLTHYAMARHFSHTLNAKKPVMAFLEEVMERQASLVAQWMSVGFIHGVMNTDNMAISGETIDYGPCAFMDAFDFQTVFSSIDRQGRYAYGAQPSMARWNLARLAECLLPLLNENEDKAIAEATEVLEGFSSRYRFQFEKQMTKKLGLEVADAGLFENLMALLQKTKVDMTLFFRRLSDVVRGNSAPVQSLFVSASDVTPWLDGWLSKLHQSPKPLSDIADAMDGENPLYIPRNHKVEEALSAATIGDMKPFETLVDLVRQPFVARSGFESHTQPAPKELGPYRTFCGT